VAAALSPDAKIAYQASVDIRVASKFKIETLHAYG